MKIYTGVIAYSKICLNFHYITIHYRCIHVCVYMSVNMSYLCVCAHYETSRPPPLFPEPLFSHKLESKHTSTHTAANPDKKHSTGMQPGMCAVILERQTGGKLEVVVCLLQPKRLLTPAPHLFHPSSLQRVIEDSSDSE